MCGPSCLAYSDKDARRVTVAFYYFIVSRGRAYRLLILRCRYCVTKNTFDISTLLPNQTIVLHTLLGPASLATSDLEVGSESLHGPRCWSKSCGETLNTFLRKISIIKHETIQFVSRNAHTAISVTSTYHLDHLCRVQFMNLEKVRPHAGHGSRMESMTDLNTVEMKGRSEFARGVAAQLIRASQRGSGIKCETLAPRASVA